MGKQHSQGPWTFKELICSGGGWAILSAAVGGRTFSLFKSVNASEADARLAAAAPELFKALAPLVDAMPVNGGMVRFDGDELAAARAAVAKARG